MRRLLSRVFLSLSVTVALGGIYLGLLEVTGNFHEVIAGQLYRSNQPDEDQLAHYVKEHAIKTVINLRGENEKSDWYRNEIAASEKLGVNHIDFGMSAQRQLTPEKAARLVQIMRDAPKPILIHCKSGADRTGLASAIYVGKIAGMNENAAEQQLSIRFGHFGIPYLSSTYAMDESWEAIEEQTFKSGENSQSIGLKRTVDANEILMPPAWAKDT